MARRIAMVEGDASKLASVNAITPWSEATKKYSFFPTTDVLNEFANHGWLVNRAMETKTKIEGKVGFQKHLIRLRQENSVPKLGDLHPEIVVQNAPDGTSSLKIHGGFYRLICSNGLIISAQQLGGQTFRHYHSVNELIMPFLNQLRDYMERFDLTLYSKVKLNDKAKASFARSALELRGLSEDDIKLVDVSEVYKPQRVEDNGDDAWTFFNRLQENLMNGNFYFHKERNDPDLQPRKARPIGANISLNMSFNTGMWGLLNEYAKVA
jgi:hypothetical protein